MRKYRDSREASSEMLRLVIPRMVQHPAGCTPASYALWYEYLSGANPALTAAMDGALRDGALLDTAAVEELFGRFVAGPGLAEEGLHAELLRMMGELSQHAALAGTRAGEYDQRLDRFGEQLRNREPGAQDGAILSLLSDTTDMRASTQALRKRLQDSSREVGVLRAELARAKGEAQTDPLTGIRNRRGLESAVSAAQAAGTRGLAGCCLIMLDIDHFKKCNDTYGHLFGDKVIRSVARTMAAHIKGQDTAARIGGEEFAILLPDTPLEGALTLAERLRAAIQNGRIRRGGSTESVGNVTVSLGVASHGEGEAFEALLRRADQALYRSKRDGRNRVTPAGPALATALSATA
ncbi:MAG: GGDEF domain-containing protein [Betaproteobacteria bacterium]